MDDSKVARCAAQLRGGAELGRTQHGGLSGKHHFSFATYQRSDRLDWGCLRAVHLYHLKAGAAREPTFHAGFEIVTLVIDGLLRRTGSHNPREPLCPGSVEVISTGLGAYLGMAALGDEPGHYLEIWIKSDQMPKASRRRYRASTTPHLGKAVVSNRPDASQGLVWKTDAALFRARLATGETADFTVEAGQRAYLVVLRGEIEGNDIVAGAEDALAITGPGLLRLRATAATEFLLIRVVDSAPGSTRAQH